MSSKNKVKFGDQEKEATVEDFSTELEEEKQDDSELVIENTSIGCVRLAPKEGETVGAPILPGENALSKADWDHAKENPAIAMLVARNILINNGPGKARPILETLDSFHFMDAKALVAKERDKKQLEKWYRGTKDPQTKAMCNTALENWS